MEMRVYAIGSQDSNLYRIDPATAVATVIGPTGLAPVGGGLAYVETVIPEPGGWLLAFAGLAAITVLRRRARA
jgi:MYXO-CTERM domain-containing protein